jgi:hypothetical protein
MKFEGRKEIIEIGDLVVNCNGKERLVVSLGTGSSTASIIAIDLNGFEMASFKSIEDLRGHSDYSLSVKNAHLKLSIDYKEV